MPIYGIPPTDEDYLNNPEDYLKTSGQSFGFPIPGQKVTVKTPRKIPIKISGKDSSPQTVDAKGLGAKDVVFGDYAGEGKFKGWNKEQIMPAESVNVTAQGAGPYQSKVAQGAALGFTPKQVLSQAEFDAWSKQQAAQPAPGSTEPAIAESAKIPLVNPHPNMMQGIPQEKFQQAITNTPRKKVRFGSMMVDPTNPSDLLAAHDQYIKDNAYSLGLSMRQNLSTPDRPYLPNPAEIQQILSDRFMRNVAAAGKGYESTTERNKLGLSEYGTKVAAPASEERQRAFEQAKLASGEQISRERMATEKELERMRQAGSNERAQMGAKFGIAAKQMERLQGLSPEEVPGEIKQMAEIQKLYKDQIYGGEKPVGVQGKGNPPVGINPPPPIGGGAAGGYETTTQGKATTSQTKEDIGKGLVDLKRRQKFIHDADVLAQSFKTQVKPEGVIKGKFDEKAFEGFADFISQHPDMVADPEAMKVIASKLKGAGGLSDSEVKSIIAKGFAKFVYGSSGANVAGRKDFGGVGYNYTPSTLGNPGRIDITGTGTNVTFPFGWTKDFSLPPLSDQEALNWHGIAPMFWNTRDPREQERLKSKAQAASALLKAFYGNQ